MEEKKEGKKEEKQERKHFCSICGKPSDSVICPACEDRVRAEALEHKHDVEKGGK
jgi:recombinational DNA repair protein RecR